MPLRASLRLLFLLLLVLAGPLSSFAQLPVLGSGTLKRLEKFPSNYVQPRTVDVWLPANYDPAKRYATLYMHDGQALFDSTTTWNRQEWCVDETMGALLQAGKIRDCLVVAIWNNGSARFAEYFPQKALAYLPAAVRDTLLRQELGNKPQADKYLRFLVKELKPYIDAHFATARGPQNTFVAGSSMGGLLSLYAICEYPRVFGGAACLSTHWPGSLRQATTVIPQAFNSYVARHAPNPATHRLYFDHGTATLDAAYQPSQLLIDATLQKAGYTSLNLMTKEFVGADHSERSWSRRFALPAEFLLGKKVK